MKTRPIYLLITMLFALITSCQKDSLVAERQPDLTYNPVILPANFTNSTNVCNPYFPYTGSKKYIFEGQTGDGLERIRIERLNTNKIVSGINCAVIRDRVYIAGLLVEDTADWFAQDNTGLVWYMGEYVTDFNPDGTVKDHAGSWEAGVDGAKPGFQMLANPQPGDAYRQEYAFNIAEDKAEIVEIGLTVVIPYGTFTNCIKVKESSDIIPDLYEFKIYAPGIGLIKEINVTDNEEIVLVEIQK